MALTDNGVKIKALLDGINALSDAAGGLPEGAAANQQLVTDADGNAAWDDRTHWKGKGDTILAETTFAVDADSGIAVIDMPIGLETGKDYLVVWNGVEYICTAIAVSMDGMELVFIGDMAAAGGTESTGEPFLIGYVAVEHLIQFMPLDNITSGSLSIHQYGYHKLDARYLPNPTMLVDLTGSDVVTECSADRSFDEILNAINAGSYVVFRHVLSDGTIRYMQMNTYAPSTTDVEGTVTPAYIAFSGVMSSSRHDIYMLAADGTIINYA